MWPPQSALLFLFSGERATPPHELVDRAVTSRARRSVRSLDSRTDIWFQTQVRWRHAFAIGELFRPAEQRDSTIPESLLDTLLISISATHPLISLSHFKSNSIQSNPDRNASCDPHSPISAPEFIIETPEIVPRINLTHHADVSNNHNAHSLQVDASRLAILRLVINLLPSSHSYFACLLNL